MYCNILWCTVIYCDVLWYTVIYCDILWCTVIYCGILWCTVMYCNILWYTVMYCNILWCTVIYCDILWYTVVYNHGMWWSIAIYLHPLCRNIHGSCEHADVCKYWLITIAYTGNPAFPHHSSPFSSLPRAQLAWSYGTEVTWSGTVASRLALS